MYVTASVKALQQGNVRQLVGTAMALCRGLQEEREGSVCKYYTKVVNFFADTLHRNHSSK